MTVSNRNSAYSDLKLRAMPQNIDYRVINKLLAIQSIRMDDVIPVFYTEKIRTRDTQTHHMSICPGGKVIKEPE